MYRPAIGTLIVAAILGMAGPAPAELPMSPIYRTDQPTKPEQPRAAPAASNPAAPAAAAAATKGTSGRRAKSAQPLPERHTASGKAVDATAADSAPVVATAPIPPPLPPPAAEPETLPSTDAPQRVATAPRKHYHALRRHYAYSRYPAYRRVTGWGSGWAASGGAHFGPNPYSPNGGD